MLPDTTQQHQTHHGYSYPPSSHLSSHWVRALQPSTALSVCLTASYPLQHLYNISTTLYNTLQSTASTVYNLYNTPLATFHASPAPMLLTSPSSFQYFIFVQRGPSAARTLALGRWKPSQTVPIDCAGDRGIPATVSVAGAKPREGRQGVLETCTSRLETVDCCCQWGGRWGNSEFS